MELLGGHPFVYLEYPTPQCPSEEEGGEGLCKKVRQRGATMVEAVDPGNREKVQNMAVGCPLVSRGSVHSLEMDDHYNIRT